MEEVIDVSKPNKYWYRTEIEMCVLCGSEKTDKFRVYDESRKGMVISETACWCHFI